MIIFRLESFKSDTSVIIGIYGKLFLNVVYIFMLYYIYKAAWGTHGYATEPGGGDEPR